MEPVSSLTPNSDGDEDKTCLMALNITELISILRTAYRTVDYDRVEEVLVDKESNLKAEIGMLSEKLETERLEKMKGEEQLKKYKEKVEKGKKAEERYEKLLQAVKKNKGLGDGNTVTELRNRNRKLEDEKRRIESVMGSWKRKCEELNERILILEKESKSSMNGCARVEIRANDDEGDFNEDIDEMELNEVVKRAVGSGNTPADSFPSRRNAEFVNLASENARLKTEGILSHTEDGHDDRSIQKQYNTRSQRRGSHNEVQDASGKSFWGNMPERQEVAKINKRTRGKRTIRHTSGLKTQASKKAKMDAQHQRKINGNEIYIEVNKHKDGIASPTVQTGIGTIVEKESQLESSNEMVFDGRGDISTQALEMSLHDPEPSESVRGMVSGPNLNEMLGDYMSHYLTPSNEKVTSLGQQLEKLKALNSMFTQVMKNQSEL